MIVEYELKGIALYDKLIQEKVEEIYRLKCMAIKVSPSSDPDKVQASSPQDKLAECVSKIADLENEMNEMIEVRHRLKEKAIFTFARMQNEKYVEFLCLRYFDKKTISEIAEIYDMTTRNVKYIQKKALIEYQKYNI